MVTHHLFLRDFEFTPYSGLIQSQGHNGESREERLAEFLIVNPNVKVVAIKEGTGMCSRLSGLMWSRICHAALPW